VEVTWKDQIKLMVKGNTSEYSAFMGNFSTLTGAVTLIMMLFVGGNVIRRFGWTRGALITPIVLLVTGAGFFAFIIFRDQLAPYMMGLSPVVLAVLFGQAQNIMSKSTKYSLFDPTKEMAYVPLDQESKVKGKAAIDVVGARLGKSGGAAINAGLIAMMGSIAVITPYVAGILFLIIFAWIYSAKALGKMYNKLTAEKEQAKAAAPAAEPTMAKATVQS